MLADYILPEWILQFLCSVVPRTGCELWLDGAFFALFLIGVYLIRGDARARRESKLENRRPKHLHITRAD